MTADELCEWLRTAKAPQREKLGAIERDHAAAIAAMFDDDRARVIREIKKRINSPRLADEVAKLVATLAQRTPNPRPVQARPPAPDSPAQAPVTASPATEVAAQLEAVIGEAPDVRDGYVVYGDWLEERGDPRGRLVAIGGELAKAPGHQAMLAAHRDHLAAHPEILGPLADCDDMLTDVAWFMGFIHKARASYTSERFNGDRKPDVSLETLLGWLLDEPGPGRFIQDLTLGLARHDDNVHAPACRVIARRPRPALRRLFVGDYTYEDCELNWSHIGDLSTLWPSVPNLRDLTLRGGSMKLGPINLPKLERLTTITGGLDAESLGHVAAADWPALHTLSLHIGRGREGAAGDVAVLAPLLAGDRVPRLTALGIVNCEFVDPLLERLVDSPLLPRLASLDVSLGTMSADGVAVIERHRDKFAHLALDVGENYLPDAAEARLAACVKSVVVGGQRDDDGDPDDRYARMVE